MPRSLGDLLESEALTRLVLDLSEASRSYGPDRQRKLLAIACDLARNRTEPLMVTLIGHQSAHSSSSVQVALNMLCELVASNERALGVYLNGEGATRLLSACSQALRRTRRYRDGHHLAVLHLAGVLLDSTGRWSFPTDLIQPFWERIERIRHPEENGSISHAKVLVLQALNNRYFSLRPAAAGPKKKELVTVPVPGQ